MQASLLVLLIMSCAVSSSALVVRQYLDTEISAITKSTRIPKDNSTDCEKECDEKLCYGYNYNNGICQIFEMMSSTTQFQCSRPVKVKVATCSYELADELCADVEKVLLNRNGPTLTATCGESQALVYKTENSTQPNRSATKLECDMATAEWKSNGEEVGTNLKMGCISNGLLGDLCKGSNVTCDGLTCNCGAQEDMVVEADGVELAKGLRLRKAYNEADWIVLGEEDNQVYGIKATRITATCRPSVRIGLNGPLCPVPVIVKGNYDRNTMYCEPGTSFIKGVSTLGEVCYQEIVTRCVDGFTCDRVTPFALSVVYCN